MSSYRCNASATSRRRQALRLQRSTVRAVDVRALVHTLLDARAVASFVDCAGVRRRGSLSDAALRRVLRLRHFASSVCCAYHTISCGPQRAGPRTGCHKRHRRAGAGEDGRRCDHGVGHRGTTAQAGRRQPVLAVPAPEALLAAARQVPKAAEQRGRGVWLHRRGPRALRRGRGARARRCLGAPARPIAQRAARSVSPALQQVFVAPLRLRTRC